MSIEQDLRNWSKYVLEVPNKHLNGLPACPFARKAWIDNKVRVIEAKDDVILSAIHNRHQVGQYELVVIASYAIPDPDVMYRTIEAMNILCAKDDLYFMCFHPEYGAEDAELDFLYDTDWESNIDADYCMIFIQSLSMVDDASKQLEEKGYYRNIPEDEYQNLVIKRRQLREEQNHDEAKSNEKD